MTILNFIPMLVWALAMMFLSVIDDHINARGDSEVKARAKVIVCGLLFWLILGIVCSVK